MSTSFNHSQIENIIRALDEPGLYASDYLVLKPDERIEHELYNEIRLYKEALLILNQYHLLDSNKYCFLFL